MQKIKFQRGSVVTPAYLNESQNSISFDGTEREDYFSTPSPTEEQSWDIGTRDKLKDWEIDNSSDSTLGRLAYGGRVLGVTANTAEIVYGPPSTTTYNSIRDEENVFLGLDSTSVLPTGSYGLIVEGGSMVSPTGDAWAWAREYFIVSTGQTVYGIYHGLDQELKLVNDVPSRALPFSLLFRVTIDQAGTISEYVDLRPHTHLDNLFTYTQGVVNTSIIGSDYTASSWERVLVDTRNSSITITLPTYDDSSDSDEIVIIDIFNAFSESYSLTVIPPTESDPNKSVLLENSSESLDISVAGTTVELFLYKDEQNGQAIWKRRIDNPIERSLPNEVNTRVDSFVEGDFIKGVILLHEAPTSSTIPITLNYCNGEFYFRRGSQGSLLRMDTVKVNSGAAYQNLEGSLFSQSRFEPRLVTCDFLGKKYLALEIPYMDSTYAEVFFRGLITSAHGNSLLYRQYYKTNTQEIINQEIYDSIAPISESYGYWGSNGRIESNRVFINGDAVVKVVQPPTSSNSSGDIGDIAYDQNYFYICTAEDTWARQTLDYAW